MTSPFWRSKTDMRPMRWLNWASTDCCFTERFAYPPLTIVTSVIIHLLCSCSWHAVKSWAWWNLSTPAVNNVCEPSAGVQSCPPRSQIMRRRECAASTKHCTKHVLLSSSGFQVEIVLITEISSWCVLAAVENLHSLCLSLPWHCQADGRALYPVSQGWVWPPSLLNPLMND